MVRLVKLRKRWDCNVYDREQDRNFTISPAEASRFFAELAPKVLG